MLHYCIQIIVFQTLFLMVYDLFLKRETFFNYNRAYLLLSVIVSLILPFIKIERFKTIIPEDYVISLPEILIGNTSSTILPVQQLDPVFINSNSMFTLDSLLFLGWGIASFILIYKLYKIVKLIVKSTRVRDGKYIIIHLKNSTSAFSFFNFIFLGDAIGSTKRKTILAHEKVHVAQKHTLDLLFFEVLRVLFWFNPLTYMYQKQIAQLHEFIADSKAVKQQSKKMYYENLLSEVFDTQTISFINPFFKQSLIKKRIIMLSKSKSKQVNVFKYTLLLPLIMFMLAYTSCTAQERNHNEKLTIVQQIETLKSSISTKGTISPLEEQALIELIEMLESSKITEMKEEGSLITSNDGDAVSFAVIDEVPTFLECENLDTNRDKKDCFSKTINKFVAKNFNTKLGHDLKLVGEQRISVFFTIDKTGKIQNIKTRAPHKMLEDEAKRVINLLPEIKPGKQDGKPVNVQFFLPIVFKVQ